MKSKNYVKQCKYSVVIFDDSIQQWVDTYHFTWAEAQNRIKHLVFKGITNFKIKML